MTLGAPEVEDDLSIIEDHEFDIPCDIAAVWPEARLPHDKAEWVGFKSCGHHRLICDPCHTLYLTMRAHGAAVHCGTCGEEDVKWVHFERMVKS